MRSPRRTNAPQTARRGAAMIFAMMALLVASLLIAALLRMASLSQREMMRDELRAQASLLADAGCQRALAALRKHRDDSEEGWMIPAEQFEAGRTAVVRIKTVSNPDKPQKWTVTVVATYPLDHPDLVRVTREFEVPGS